MNAHRVRAGSIRHAATSLGAFHVLAPVDLKRTRIQFAWTWMNVQVTRSAATTRSVKTLLVSYIPVVLIKNRCCKKNTSLIVMQYTRNKANYAVG